MALRNLRNGLGAIPRNVRGGMPMQLPLQAPMAMPRRPGMAINPFLNQQNQGPMDPSGTFQMGFGNMVPDAQTLAQLQQGIPPMAPLLPNLGGTPIPNDGTLGDLPPGLRMKEQPSVGGPALPPGGPYQLRPDLLPPKRGDFMSIAQDPNALPLEDRGYGPGISTHSYSRLYASWSCRTTSTYTTCCTCTSCTTCSCSTGSCNTTTINSSCN